MVNPVAWYEANAAAVSAQYEGVPAHAVHDWLVDLLPSPPAAVLDVGAGSGRDAAWLAAQGYDVVAVEPSAAMRTAAQVRHAEAGIRWLADSLPGLERTLKTGLSFDLILLSAVWMHVAPTERARAFRKLITLLKPGGILAITLRHGPADDARGIHHRTISIYLSSVRRTCALDSVTASPASHSILGPSSRRLKSLKARLPE
jgi:SAM-dependent methyltransferase